LIAHPTLRDFRTPISLGTAERHKPVTLAEVFNTCQDIELRQAKLYAALSLLLGDVDERISRFWEQMSTEEWQHYMLVDFGRSLCAQTLGLSAPATGLPGVPIQQITDALSEHEQKIDSGQVTLNGAFEIAIAIESSEADTIYMYLLSTIKKAIYESDQPYLISRISQVERDMAAHIDHLIDATRQFSKVPELVRRAQALKEHHPH
jgi:hypothetical protein